MPDCRLYTTGGLLHLETTRITDGVLLMDIDESLRAAAVDESLPVFLPQRIYDRDRRSWPQVSSERDEFEYLHSPRDFPNCWYYRLGICEVFSGRFSNYHRQRLKCMRKHRHEISASLDSSFMICKTAVYHANLNDHTTYRYIK